MKIGIITFHASFNYGSMLQAYALHKVLSDMGHNVEIVNFRSSEHKEVYHYPIYFKSREYSKVHLLLHYMTHPVSIYHHIRKWNRFNEFLNEYLVHTREFHTVDELRNNNFQYDYIVVGSDQIWNINCRDFSEAYWGTFCGNKTRIIAYAPSMGPTPEMLKLDSFKENAPRFHAVSVREERAYNYLKDNNVFQKISLTLDPTLLLNTSVFDQIDNRRPLVEGDYAYFYEPYTKPRFLKIALNIGEQFGYKIVIDRVYPDRYIKDHKNVLFYTNTGPKEFLNLLRHAKLVIGHSLHAVLFSILYKKDFYALDGDKDSRMNYIMNALGLERRFVSIENPLLLENTHIDYWDSVYEKYELLKENSLSFLKEALSNDSCLYE